MRTRVVAAFACVVLGVGVNTQAAESNAVLVRIFRNGNSPARAEFKRKLGSLQPLTTQSGKQIVVIDIPSPEYRWRTSYRYLLEEKLGRVFETELVVLDSVDEGNLNEAVHPDAAGAVNLCAPKLRCIAFVPTWVKGEEAEAAHAVLQSLRASH